MATTTPNLLLRQEEIDRDTVDVTVANQRENMSILDTEITINRNRISSNLASLTDQIEDVQGQLDSITTTDAPSAEEIQIARDGRPTLLDSVRNSCLNRTTRPPETTDNSHALWADTTEPRAYILLDDTLNSAVWQSLASQTDVADLLFRVNELRSEVDFLNTEVIDHEKRILNLELNSELDDATEGITITNGFRVSNDLTDPATVTMTGGRYSELRARIELPVYSGELDEVTI